MKSTSHRMLAHYFIDIYLFNYSASCKKAFSLGCVQPDKNPTTYLKGSLRSQWLRGHNWENAQRYIHKIANGLERKSRLNFIDYYKLGKLIHYTADAFTYAHNLHFQADLKAHRKYEQTLDSYITECFDNISVSLDASASGILDIIHSCRISYIRTSSGIIADAAHTKRACSGILSYLSARDLFLTNGKPSSIAKFS